jgi:uncharacterized YigZ family protein
MQEPSFVTLKGIAEHRDTVKGSVFLAHGERADSPEQVNHALRAMLARHADASHLCWAYKIQRDYRFSDGGEPGGTAGQPILRAIEGQGLDHVVVGVIRYFGGTLLGAGGLMRAYGGTAAEALRTAERVEILPRIPVQIDLPFGHLGALYRLLDTFSIEDRTEGYTEEGLRIRLRLLASDHDRFTRALRDASRGQCRITRS